MSMKLQKHTTINEAAHRKPELGIVELRHQPASIVLDGSRAQSIGGEIAPMGKTFLVEGPFKHMPPPNHQ